MASLPLLINGVEMTVVGSIGGSVAGAIAEKIGDYLVSSLNVPEGPNVSLTQAGLDVIVRSSAAALVFMMTDQALISFQGGRRDLTQGMFFSFIFVQSQPELLESASRFGAAIKSKLG